MKFKLENRQYAGGIGSLVFRSARLTWGLAAVTVAALRAVFGQQKQRLAAWAGVLAELTFQAPASLDTGLVAAVGLRRLCDANQS